MFYKRTKTQIKLLLDEILSYYIRRAIAKKWRMCLKKTEMINNHPWFLLIDLEHLRADHHLALSHAICNFPA